MQDISSCSPTLFPSSEKFNGECYLMPPYIGSIALTRLPVFLSIPPRSLPRWTGKIFFLIAPVLFYYFHQPTDVASDVLKSQLRDTQFT